MQIWSFSIELQGAHMHAECKFKQQLNMLQVTSTWLFCSTEGRLHICLKLISGNCQFMRQVLVTEFKRMLWDDRMEIVKSGEKTVLVKNFDVNKF